MMDVQLPRTKHDQINEMIDKFERDNKVHFRQVHRMIDLFETIIKTHTAFLFANYFRVNKVSDTVAKELVQGMRTPSLGTWLRFNDVVFEDLAFNHLSKNVYEAIYESQSTQNQEKMTRIYQFNQNDYIFRPEEELKQVKNRVQFLTRLCVNYDKQYNQNEKPFTNLALPSFYSHYRNWHNKMSNIIVHFRNEYAHGATPPEEDCAKHIQQHLPLLKESLSLPWLHETSVIVFNEDLTHLEVGADWIDITELHIQDTPEPYIPYLVLQDNTLLRLFPTVTFQLITNENKQSVSFFNDLKSMNRNKISYLNYPYAEHIQDDVVYSRFIEVFRIEEWRENLLDEFEDLILRLQESFKGRLDELNDLQHFVDRHYRGFLYVYGMPGIGKSALIANAFNETNDKQTVIKYFVRNRKYTHVSEVFDYLNRTLDRTYRLPSSLGYGDTEDEKQKMLQERLQHISSHLVIQNEKLIIVIDGLDEGDQALLNHLISETYAHVLVIYVARATSTVTRFINDLPLDYLTKKEVGKIKQSDIRAMLYEVVNKYEITETYVEAIAEKSDGHPLYVKLLCEALSQYPDKVNDMYYLPEKWQEFYKRFIDRFIDDSYGQSILEALFVFAAAKDYLSQDEMRLILKTNSQQNLIVFDRLSELLIKSIHDDKHYQLFHETFHEYITNNYGIDVMDAEQKILDYCLNWQSLQRYGETYLRYPMHHLAVHLRDTNDLSMLKKLVHDELYINKQIQVTGQYTASFVLIEAYRTVAYKHHDEQSVIDAMIHLLNLNNQLRSHELTFLMDEPSDEKVRLQHVHFYNNEEKGQVLFIYLWHCLKLSKDIIERVIDEVDELLPLDTRLFNWVDYVPLPLLVKLCIDLDKRHIATNFILNRVYIKESDLRRILDHMQLEERSVQIIKRFIDQVDDNTSYEWLELMNVLIEKIFDNQLQHMVKFYEKIILKRLRKLEKRYLYEGILTDLATTYVNANWQKEAFQLLENVTYASIKEAAYRQLYETYKVTNPSVANKAYHIGLDYVSHYTYDDRLDVVVKWLPIVKAEGPHSVYKKILNELETSIEQRVSNIEFVVLGDMIEHYWHDKQYDRALTLVDQMEEKELKYPVIHKLFTYSELSHDPSSYKKAIHERYIAMKEDILTNELFKASFYEEELVYIIKKWVNSGELTKVKQIIDGPIDTFTKDELLLQLLAIYYEKNDYTSMIQSAFEIEEFTHHVVDFFIDKNLTDELINYIQNISSVKNRESLCLQGAIRALEKGNSKLSNKLIAYIDTVHYQEQFKFKQIYESSMMESYDESIQSLKESIKIETINRNIVETIDVSIAERLLRNGKRKEAYDRLQRQFINVSLNELATDLITYHLVQQQFTEAMSFYYEELAEPLFCKDPYDHGLNHSLMREMFTEIVIQMSKRGDSRVVSFLESDYQRSNLFPSSLYPYLIAIKLLKQHDSTSYTAAIVTLCENIVTSQPLESMKIGATLYGAVANHCDLAYYHYKSGEKVKARYLLQKLVQFFSKEVNVDQTNLLKSHLRIAYECERQGLTVEFEQFTHTYRSLYDHYHKDVVWGLMVDLYMLDGEIDRAIDAIEKLLFQPEDQYVKIISHLLNIGSYEKAQKVYKELDKFVIHEAKESVFIAKQQLLHYLMEKNNIEAIFNLIRTEPHANNRVSLYKTMLPMITKDNLQLLLNYISYEHSDVKRHLEKEILMYTLTDPKCTTVELQLIFSTLSINQELTALALYIYRIVKELQNNQSMDDILIRKINETLRSD